MARDATARLYDVDEDALKFEKLRLANRYDQGTIAFSAKPTGQVDLAKLHESLWATRLSGGTRSGVIGLEVTAVGEVLASDGEIVLDPGRGERRFVLVDDVAAKPPDAKKSAYQALRDALADGRRVVSVTGYVDGWAGRWPDVLSKPPPARPRMMVTSFETKEE